MIHELKCLPNYFAEVISGRKTFEIRMADRPFNEGDMLALNEFDADAECYTGNSCLVYVDYILNDALYCKTGFVVMSIKPCRVWKATTPIDVRTYEPNYAVPYATKVGEGK